MSVKYKEKNLMSDSYENKMKQKFRIVQNDASSQRMEDLADIPLEKYLPQLSADHKLRDRKDWSGHPAHFPDNRALFSWSGCVGFL